MKIQKVEKLNYARFRNFNWGTTLNPFCDGANILFGWNGSGKTTFSQLFYSIERENIDGGCTFKIKTDSSTLSEANELDDLEKHLRVFNDIYIEETLRGSSKIPYIFFAGKEAVDFSEDERKLTEKRSELSKYLLPTTHGENAQNAALVIKNVTGINSYGKELIGGATYSSYNKTDFEKRINNIRERIDKKELKTHADLIRADIDDLKNQLISTDRIKKNDKEIATAAQWLIDNIDGVNELLQNNPVQEQSGRIESLKSGEVAWIKEGVAIHFGTEEKYSKCLFCDSDIKNKEELLKHFSDEVIRAIDGIDLYLRQIESNTSNLARVESPTPEQTAGISILRSIFDTITPALRDKRNIVSDKKKNIEFNIDAVKILVSPKVVDATTVAYAIEAHYVAENYIAYEQARAQFEAAQESKNKIEAEVKQLDEQVRILKQKAKNTHESASALNNLFKIVFPYRKIEIADNDDGTGYILKRDGLHCSFSSLSEGEKNFIALAYFIYSINDAQNQLAGDGIVVIDDPVSSLDKQAIFQIFSIIVNEIKENAGRQYFILTHNLDFLGHLKEYFDAAIKNNIVRLFSFFATDQGCILTDIPALLKNHRSDYYYTFSVLFKFKDTCSPEDSYLVVNLLRRWLETFLEFKFSTSGDLRSTLESAYKKASKITEKYSSPFSANHLEMYRFINHGSHGFPDTESMDDSILSNASQRIQEALQLVRILDPLHYEKLESISNN
jgi:wobble nucleotide-excising tRNase